MEDVGGNSLRIVVTYKPEGAGKVQSSRGSLQNAEVEIPT